MNGADEPTVLIVRGAGPAGRRIANAVRGVGATAVVLDERTCAHEGVHAVRVAFGDVAKPRRAVQDLMVRYGSFEGFVLLPPPATSGPETLDPSWERALGHEVRLVAGLVRAAAPALAVNAGIVVPVSPPPTASHEPTDLDHLFAGSCLPAIRALSDAFGFRLRPVATEATGAARGAEVAETLVEELEPGGDKGVGRVAGGAGASR